MTEDPLSDDAMDEILELAARLGRSIRADGRAKRLAGARTALENSLEDRQLLADYQEQQKKVRMLEIEGKPIEPEDKRKLADLHTKVISSEVLKGLLSAEADYVEMTALVSQRIEQEAFRLPGGADDGHA